MSRPTHPKCFASIVSPLSPAFRSSDTMWPQNAPIADRHDTRGAAMSASRLPHPRSGFGIAIARDCPRGAGGLRRRNAASGHQILPMQTLPGHLNANSGDHFLFLDF